MDLIEKIKAADDVVKEIVHIDEWDCDIEVRSFSGLTRATLIEHATLPSGDLDNGKLNEGVLLACLFDPETGEHLFQKEDIKWLMDKSAGPIELLIGKAMEVNRMSKKSRQEDEKN